MAELYEKPKLYANAPSGATPISGDPDLDKVLAELPPEEREEAMRKITAPPTGEEIAMGMQERNANGEMFNMTLDQYRLYKAHMKNKEVDIISTFGQAAGSIYDEITKAAESVIKDPSDAIYKLTPSLIEAFSQGTRNLYGMAAQSIDPTSVMFRMKHALAANGSDEEAEYRQFMEAQQFNIHSMNLASGKETLIMDKDVINPEMTQVMSYVADPTLFIPFGGIAAKGARLVGMGEGLAKASARAATIRNKVLGGTLKWGVGAPIEFLGNATRNTIDYGLERSASAFEFATGMSSAEAQATARQFGLNSVAGSLAGQTVPVPIVGNIAGAMVGATTAQGVGEAVGMLGEQMIKQSKNGRGVLSYAGQALRDSEKAGVQLSAHARGLLRVIDMADPLFVYSADIAEGAGHGMLIGAGLGYLSGGEEGMASGAGAGFALGAIGAGLGSVTADVTNNRLYDRIAIQRKMVIEGLKGTDDAKASAFEAYVKAAELTGDRRYMAEVDGMIAGIDLMSPNSKWNIRTEAEHTAWLQSLKIDPKTGRLVEETAILPQFGTDRKQRASALSFLSMVSDNFSGLPENLLQHLNGLPEDHAMSKHWSRLSDDAKQAVLAEVKQNANIEYRKKFGSKKSNQYYGDINYAEAHTARINALFDAGNPTQARERINMLLKEETVGGKLTERGKALKDKLATEGYFDKDGNMRPSRLKDVEATDAVFQSAAGFVLRRDSTGQVEVNLNLNKIGKVTGLHELFHAIMLDSPMKDEFIDRLSTKLLGKFDANGKRIEGASVDTAQVKKFFQRYIDSLHRNNAEERANETKRLERAIEEYEQRGDQNKVNRTTETTLEHMVEEFGAFYFPKFIQDKPVDYLFRGGELGAMREMFQSVKFGWLDFWRSKIGSVNPEFNADAIQGNKISQAFGKEGQPRYKNKALDLFMGDFVKATAMANRNGNFDLSRLSPEGQKTFVRNNGIRGYGTIDKDGKLVRLNRRTALREEMRVGKEIYKVVAGLDPKLRQGLTLDGEGNFSGRVSPELADALVASGHIERAWVDKLLRAYDIIDGKESNVIEFGYLGRTAQIGDYAWPRLVGSDVPFKNRTAILLDVDFKIGKDGRMTALYHTLDHAVIEGRANAIWSDPAIRSLWDGSRTAMEADFFRYLSNASLPADHPERVSSAKLLEDGSGKGAMRRNALHQMLGMAKLDGDVYINKPIAEIPLGIRHSVTTFNIDGVSGMRVRQGARYDYNHRNAFRDLSRNFMMSEMDTENTPNGKIIKHTTGYKITKSAGTNKFSVFDPEGMEVGKFDSLPDAGRAAQKHYNQTFDAKVEGKDLPVPRTEIPPSRQAYIDREFGGITDNIAGGTEKFLENLNVLIDRITASGDILIGKENRDSALRIKKSIEERGNVTLSELKEIQRVEGVNRVHDTSRLPYYNYDYFLELIDTVLSKNLDRLGKQYDNMYPMEIKSALHGRLAQIFQDYPNLTAQGLLKKLDVYGSQGYRYLQEAKEIGLVDLLKSKIKPRTEVYRKMDAQGNFTGEVATREIPVQFRNIAVELKDAEGNVLKNKDGYPLKEFRETTENISGTQPVLDMQEILDFAKSKEIKVTIEEGAREVNGMDTEQLTLGGDKSNYKQTAIRINPEYAHGVRGHYGKDTIVHFRTTERLDAEGNKVLFIEEVQANNPYTEKAEPNHALINYERRASEIESAKKLRDELISRGLFVLSSDGTYKTSKDLLVNDFDYRTKILKAIADVTDSRNRNTPMADLVIFNEIEEAVSSTALTYSRDDIIGRLDDVFSDEDTFDLWSKLKKNKDVLEWVDAAAEINKKMSEFRSDMSDYYDKSGLEYSNIEYPENLISTIADRESRLAQLQKSVETKKPSFPLTEAKDWTLSALKGIIRQAIRDGLDTITLTHPDDSPTVSHMKEGARRGLYGKTIPEVWGAWLRKYGIEIAQQNKLRDATIDTYRANLVEIQNKIPDASKKVMDKFQQVYAGERTENIKVISEIFSTPVHEMTENKLVELNSTIALLRDQGLANACEELSQLKRQEMTVYGWMETARQEGVAGLHDSLKHNQGGIVKAGQSAEAIDRGMTFQLNDAIKRDFLDGKIKTHMMMSEGEDIYAGGRTYNQNSKKWKSGFIGLWAEENPERLKGYNIEFFQKEAGAYRIRLQDNSVKGRTVDVGHITAVVSGDTATISTKIADEYQGNKLSYALYSEMAERLRAMGIRRVDGQIVNRDGVPIRVRERIIGDTRDYFSGKPIDQIEGAIRIREKQEQFGNMAGVDVYNTLDPKARYMMAEDIGSPQNVTEVHEWLNEVRNKGGDYTAVPMSESIKQTFGNLEAFKKARKEDMLTALEKAMRYGSQQAKDLLESVKSGKTPIKDAVDWIKKNGDFYTYNAELKDIRDERANLAKAVLRAMGEMRKISDKDGRRYNTEGEREHRNTMRQMPEEGDDINTIVKRNLNDIVKSTKGFYHTHNVVGIIEQYIHRFKGVDVSDVSRYVELKEEHNRLDRLMNESEDYYNSLSEEESRNPPDDAPNLPEDIRDEMSSIMDEMDTLRNSISDSVAERKNVSFDDLVNLYEEANALEKTVRKNKSLKDWESFKKKYKNSSNEEVFEGIERVLRDNEASKLPKLFESELYSGHSSTGEPKGLIIDILKREGKIKADGLTYGSKVNPQRLINLLKNEAGSGNKAYTEAQAIGFIDWLKLRMGGIDNDVAGGINPAQPMLGRADMAERREQLNLKGKQNTIPTSEVLNWLDKNQLDVRIDKIPVPNVDSNRYVSGGETEGYRDLVIRMPERYSHGVEGHFGNEKTNVVAHVRVTFRRDAEGKKVMHIEEIQANNANVDVLPSKERETYKQVVKELVEAELKYSNSTLSDVNYFNLRQAANAEIASKPKTKGKGYWANAEEARRGLTQEKSRIEKDFEDKSKWADLSFKKFEEYVNKDFQNSHPETTKYLRHIYDRQMAEAVLRLEAKKALEKTKLWNNEPEQLSDVDQKTGIKYPAMTELSRLRSELQTASEKEGNKAPLQDPKEWIKLAFRTILREATVEGVDRVTLTPYDKTPMQVGMNKDSAKSLYGKIIPQYFESELAKINQKLDVKNKNDSIIEQRLSNEYIDLKDFTQKRIKDVSTKWDTSQPTHENAGEVFRFLHGEDSTLISNHASINGEFNRTKFDKFKDKISDLAERMPSGNNRNLIIRAVNAKFQQMNHYTNWKFSEAFSMDKFGESASLVDRSIGFDMTDKAKELGKQSRPHFQPAEGWRDWQSERTSVGSVIKNTAGYVIMVQKGKFKVYNPYKAMVGIYDSEEQAKRRVQKDEPKR